MKVRLKVLSGKSAGKEINLNAGEFLIGRGDGCQLRPRTDAISRKHCRFFVADDEVRVSDLQSRNGTFVNGQKIAAEVTVKPGDKISVGPLQFELVNAEGTSGGSGRVAPVKAAQPPAETSNAKARHAAPSSAGAPAVDNDIFGWLEEADEVDRAERMVDPGTRQFQLNKAAKTDGETIDLAKSGETTTDNPKDDKKKEKEKKKEPGKLPKLPEKDKHVNSQAAAADALRQFFKRS
jgi:pSer/pThr/pTyr-binding forkhead associated (FHA) protein